MEAGAAKASAPSGKGRLATYYVLLVTQTLSLIGSQISEYAVGIAVFRDTGEATPLAIVAFFQVVPPILIAGYCGALADRFDRRRLMLIAHLGFVATSGLLLWSYSSGVFQLWHLYVLSGAASAFATLDRAAFQPSVALLVPDSGRDRANAIAQMTNPAAGVIAPAAAGLLYGMIGVPGAILIDIATFFVAIGVLLAVSIPMPARVVSEREKEPAIWRQLFDGFRHLATMPVLLGVCVFVSVVNLIANVPFVLLTPYVLARTGSPELMGVVLTVMNVGGIAGALAISAGVRFGSRMNTVMLGIVAAGLFVGLAGVARDPWTLSAALFLLLIGLGFSNAPFWSILQAKIPPAVQGRVFSAYMQVVMVTAPISFAVAGPLADQVFEPGRATEAWDSVGWMVGTGPGAGMGLMFVVSGALILAISLAVYAIPAVRRLESDLPDQPAAAA